MGKVGEEVDSAVKKMRVMQVGAHTRGNDNNQIRQDQITSDRTGQDLTGHDKRRQDQIRLDERRGEERIKQ